jgi:hypothetical protein
MNMSNSGSNGRLRRSSRAPKKSNTEYSVGDVVEVRDSFFDKGCIQNISDRCRLRDIFSGLLIE